MFHSLYMYLDLYLLLVIHTYNIYIYIFIIYAYTCIYAYIYAYKYIYILLYILYKYPLHIKKVLNKCRHLHNIICDENSRKNLRLAQLDVDIKIIKYNIDLESKVLSSNNKSIFYKFINKKFQFIKLYIISL